MNLKEQSSKRVGKVRSGVINLFEGGGRKRKERGTTRMRPDKSERKKSKKNEKRRRELREKKTKKKSR